MAESALSLVERLRAELDADAAEHQAVHRCKWGDYWYPEDEPCKALRTVAAHRKILDRHGPGVSHPEECGRCNDPFPCDDVLALASVYFPEAPEAPDQKEGS